MQAGAPKRRRLITTNSDDAPSPAIAALVNDAAVVGSVVNEAAVVGSVVNDAAVVGSVVNDAFQPPRFEYVMTVSQRWGFSSRNESPERWWVVGRSLDTSAVRTYYARNRAEPDGWRYQLEHVHTGVRSETLITDPLFPVRYTRTIVGNPFRVCIVGAEHQQGVCRSYEIFVDPILLKQCIETGTAIDNEECIISDFESFSSTKHYQLELRPYAVMLEEASRGFAAQFNRRFTLPSQPRLFPEQVASLEWMVAYENKVRHGTLQITTNGFTRLGDSGYSMTTWGSMFVNNDSVHPRSQTPRLGILSNATGSGKTAIVINLIKMSSLNESCGLSGGGDAPGVGVVDFGGVSNDTEGGEEDDFINRGSWTDAEAGRLQMIMTSRRSRATLVVVPINLPAQWFDEFTKFYPSGKVLKLTNKREHEALRYADLLNVDCVITTMAFLCGTGYKRKLSTQLGSTYYGFPLKFSMRARGIVNSRGFDNVTAPILQLIWWRRVIFDEAHEMVTDPSHPARILHWTLVNLHGNVKWALTGTPNMGSWLCRDMYVALALNSAAAPTITAAEAYKTPISSFPLVDSLMRSCYHKNDVIRHRARLEVHEYRVQLTPHEYRLINSYRLQNPVDIVQLATTYNVLDPAFQEELSSDGNSSSIKMLSLDQIEEHVQLARTRDIVRLRHEETASQMQLNATVSALAETERQLLEDAGNLRISSMATVLRAKQVKQTETLLAHSQKLEYAQTEYRFFQKQLHEGGSVLTGSVLPPSGSAVSSVLSDTRVVDGGDTRVLGVPCQANDGVAVEEMPKVNTGECPICMVNSTHVITRCGHWYCKDCAYKMVTTNAKCALCKRKLLMEDVLELNNSASCGDIGNEVMIEEGGELTAGTLAYGSKMVAIVEKIREIVACNEKIVMFVQWNRLMRSIKMVLKMAGVHASTMDGNTNARANGLVQFQTGSSKVLLISIENGASGLNLIEANHVMFTHALVSHSAEDRKVMYDQAIGRVNRMGQSRDVIHVHWFISRETVEENLFNAFI